MAATTSQAPSWMHTRDRPVVLPTTRDLIDRLNTDEVRYCHWKSNWTLERTLEGDTDLDLLVHRHDARRFRTILRDLHFNPAVEAGTAALAAVEHYHARDEATDRIAHVHAYYRIITGESLAKNYRLPLEDMLLGHTRREGILAIPTAGAELIVFVLRMLVKHTTPIELALFLRDRASFRAEVAWLATPEARDEALALLPRWLPQIDRSLFIAAYDALRDPAPLPRRVALGIRVRGRLRRLARHHPVRARVTEAGKFTARSGYRLTGSKKKLTPGSGGAVIAFVGSEATGKSTVIEEIARWLGQHFTVRRIHAGKPPSTPITVLPHAALPALRALLPDQRSTRVDARIRTGVARADDERTYPLAFTLRAVMLAYERRALLTRAFAHAANGAIVLSDRYPSSDVNAPDGVQLAHLSAADPLRQWLASVESRIYAEIPPPDVVIHLTAPLDVTLERNANRAKTEPEDYVRLRHSAAASLEFDRTRVYKLDSSYPLSDVIRQVKEIIWDSL